MRDQQSLVLILRKYDGIWKSGETLTHVFERDTRGSRVSYPKIQRRHFVASLQNGFGEANLLVKLQGPRLYCQSA